MESAITYQHLIISEGLHFVMQFDVSYLNEASHKYNGISEQVQTQFICINLNMLLAKNELYSKVIQDISMYPGIQLSDDAIGTLASKFYIRNHMFSVNIEFRNKLGALVEIPIEKLYLYTECAYYSKKRTPSMVMFVNHSTATGIFTRGGKMNLVGGYTQHEVKYALIMFLGRIEEGMRRFYNNANISIKITKLKLENYVVSSKLPFSKIDIYNASKFTDVMRIPRIFVPEHYNLLNVRPFRSAAPSVHIRIFPTGGIVLAGCKSLFEINVAIQFLASIIKPFIVPAWPTTNTAKGVLVDSWARDREIKMFNRELMKLKQMQRKRMKWEEQKQAKMTELGLHTLLKETSWQFDNSRVKIMQLELANVTAALAKDDTFSEASYNEEDEGNDFDDEL